jgi:hypothetical protein
MAEVGRPTKMTEEVIRKIEEVAALDGSVAEMAYYAGVHVDSVYTWLKDNKEFSDRITALRERPVLKARQTIVKALDQPDYAMKYLERKKKNEFSTRTENTGADGKDLIPEAMTGEEKEALLSLLNDKRSS